MKNSINEKNILASSIHRHKIIAIKSLFLILISLLFLTIQPKPVYSYCKTPFIMPLKGTIVVKFRQSYWDNEKEIYRKHTGIDIEGEYGQKVMAAANGVVSYIGFSPIGGRTLVIKHNKKIRTTYLNLMQIYVSVGSYIKQGEVIASIGATDDPSSESCHLHFGIIYNGKYLDPEDVLGIDYSSISKFLYLKYLPSDFKLSFSNYQIQIKH